ncbi:hypothetical protein Ocepr_1117 [Oceanithermus profundus DSM 14977]|uniref:Uncharacterized protein n=1 Tax=Oceanithermus profundus (strain DSM 14977 / NBRC 100410 / VKM B-2274 / 506) TaxID=670487 RepID=E4U7X5_OCEP5|nr:hypothetical protein [Oceanithermus profundus]ADR36574.1 hypothetical protein Ocepr_1117 [Oceanithermus profundus DSM 14977]
MPSERPKVKISINGTAIVLAVVALVAFRAGAVPAAWALVWAYLAGVLLLAAVVAWIGMVAPSGQVQVAAVAGDTAPRGDEGLFGRGARVAVFSVWVAVTAVAFLYLAFSGHPLLLLPALSLVAVVLPGAGERLLVDEYVRSVLVRASTAAHAAGLGTGFLVLVLARPTALELFAVVLAVYAIVLEWAAWRELR